MLDLKQVRDNPDRFKAGLQKRGRDPGAIDEVLRLDAERRRLLTELEQGRALQNKASAEVPKLKGDERTDRISEMKALAGRLRDLEPVLERIEADLDAMLRALPNQPDDTVPSGADASDNVVVHTHGAPTRFDFDAEDHVTIGARLGILDFERGAKASGSRFYYLKGAGVLLELAIVRLALDLLAREGSFTLMETPMIVRSSVITGAWGGGDLDTQQTYKIEDEEMALIGTSEQPLAAYHMDETLDAAALPVRYAGLSWCFRREAGSYGKDTRGLYRVHQFYKVEMFSYTLPDRSRDEHEYLVGLEERYVQALGLPYRRVVLCGGDLGQAMQKTYDIETWMPGRGGYGETHSCSNAGDFQARRLGIRFKSGAKGSEYAHTLNGTLVATSRALIAVLENYQQADGSVRVPEALVPYMGGLTELRTA
jgi:seryl-tRNA synthetase